MPENAKTEYPKTVLASCMNFMQMKPEINIRIAMNEANFLYFLTFVAAMMTMESPQNRRTPHCKRYV